MVTFTELFAFVSMLTGVITLLSLVFTNKRK